jgi:exonuclease SbcC
MTHQNQFNPISKITIENFQSHECTKLLPAGPGQLTVIVGQSRQGKTAIFRALRWLFYNSPDGTDFIRWGCTFARVAAEYADGTQVIRYRTSGSKNQYIIRKPSLVTGQKRQFEEQVYEGFGRGAVPLEVQQVTGVSPVEIGEGLTLNLNLAEQLDGPFLGNKSVSSTARAKVLGKLAGTEEVDLAGKQLGTDLYRWKREQEAHEKAIKETKEQLREYDYLPEFKANLDRLADIRGTVKATMEKRELLDKLYREYAQVNLRANEERLRMLRLRELIEKLVLLVESIHCQIWSISKMQQVKAELDEITASILAAEATIKRTQGLSQAEELLKSAEGRFWRRQQAETIITRWNKMIWDLEQVEKVIGKTQGIFRAETLVDLGQKDLARIDSLFAIYRQFGTVKMGICKADSVLYETKAVLSVEPMITELYSFMDRKSKLAMLYGKWDQSREDMAAIERQRQNAESDVNKYSDKYYETLKQAGKCPLCGANTNIDYGRVI